LMRTRRQLTSSPSSAYPAVWGSMSLFSSATLLSIMLFALPTGGAFIKRCLMLLWMIALSVYKFRYFSKVTSVKKVWMD
jgi:hypothetical protein